MASFDVSTTTTGMYLGVSTYIRAYGSVTRINSSTIRISGTYQVTQSNAWNLNAIYAWSSGSGAVRVKPYSNGGGTWTAGFSYDVGVSASAGTYSGAVGFQVYNNAESGGVGNAAYLNFSASYGEGYTNPSTPSVSISSKTYNSATFNVSISSYGNPSSTSGRYIEAALLQQNSYDASTSNGRRWSTASNTTSASITVNKSSNKNGGSDGNGFTITGNSKYYYGGYATNTQKAVSTVVGTIYLPCPPLSALSLSAQSYSAYNKVNATFSYTRQSDGGAETRTGYYRYSTDGGTTYSSWTSFGTVSNTTGTFNVTLPTSTSVIMQAKLTTPNGGDSGIKSVTITTKTTHTAPNFSNFTYQDTASAAIALTGNNQIFIQSQSQPRVTISTANKATANDGASISSYTASLNAQSIQIAYSASQDVSGTFSANTPTASGTLALSISANDSLSLSKSVSKNITVIPWAKPVLTATATRANNFENETTLRISGSYSQIKVNNVVKNTLTVAYRFKKSSSSEWGSWTNRPITITDSNYAATDLVLSFDNEYQWDIQVRAVDKFSTTTQSITLSIGKPILFVSKNKKVSINRKPTNSNADLDVEGFIYQKDQPVMTSHVGMVIMSTTLTTAADVKAVYGGNWTSYSGISVSGLYCWRRTS